MISFIEEDLIGKNSFVGLARGLLDARRGARHSLPVYRPGASPTVVSARALLGLCYWTMGWAAAARRRSLRAARTFSFFGKRPDGSRGLLLGLSGRDATRCAMLGWALLDGASAHRRRAPRRKRPVSVLRKLALPCCSCKRRHRGGEWRRRASTRPGHRKQRVFNLTRTSRPGRRGRDALRTPRRT